MAIYRPIAFVMASTNHGTMIVNRHDYKPVEGGAVGVGHQLLSFSSFDQNEVDTVLQLLNSRRQHFGDGVMAIDCGANIGVHTIEWARFMHGWGEVLAFEAQERIYYALAGNISINNCFNARAFWAAVGHQNGSIQVPKPDYLIPASYGSLELIPSEHNEFIGQNIDYQHNTMPTQMIAIDDLGMRRLDFIKIDVEGMELAVLSGAKRSIAEHKPMMLIEKIKTNEQELSAFLTSLAYTVFPFGNNVIAVHKTDPGLPLIRLG